MICCLLSCIINPEGKGGTFCTVCAKKCFITKHVSPGNWFKYWCLCSPTSFWNSSSICKWVHMISAISTSSTACTTTCSVINYPKILSTVTTACVSNNANSAKQNLKSGFQWRDFKKILTQVPKTLHQPLKMPQHPEQTKMKTGNCIWHFRVSLESDASNLIK